MTQLESARKGVVTPEIVRVAIRVKSAPRSNSLRVGKRLAFVMLLFSPSLIASCSRAVGIYGVVVLDRSATSSSLRFEKKSPEKLDNPVSGLLLQLIDGEGRVANETRTDDLH